MSEEQIENKVIELIKTAEENLRKGLNNTKYYDKIEEILSYYIEFLKTGIAFGIINNDNINIYTITEVVYNEKSNAYARWSRFERYGTLTLAPRFFLERNSEEQKNIIFHELIHSLMVNLIKESCFFHNFSNFCVKIKDYLTQKDIDSILEKFKGIIELSNHYIDKPGNLVSEIGGFINEATTQNLAEILVAKSLNKPRNEYKKFESKILTDESILVSNFATYPEYQYVFNSFLRTINGLGTIENDEILFLEYFKMLQNETIWQQIIGAYFEKEKNFELFEFMMTMVVLKKVKEKSMGINVEYTGDKTKFTYLINSLCVKMNQLRNTDEIKNYPYVEFPKPKQEFKNISIGLKR